MIREDRFVLSRRPYAIEPNRLTIDTAGTTYDGEPMWQCTVRAVWYRRRRGITVACIGVLSDYVTGDMPVTGERFAEQYTDGRYGGTCHGRWDGTGYWGAEDLDVQTEHLALLRPMLAAYPTAPAGFSGWWRF